MNSTLKRQLKKAFGSLESIPPNLNTFLKTVSDTYDAANEDRLMIERSLEISSRELGELNKKTTEEADKLKISLSELETINKLMVDRELKMIQLKKEISDLKARQ